MNFRDTSIAMAQVLKKIPQVWNGKKAILEMKNADFPHWKQMEWIGFCFQFLCEKYLSKVAEIPGSKYGNVTFDGFNVIPWNFKAHAMNTSSHQIIVNDSEATASAIKDYGQVGLILAIGKVVCNDANRRFQKWQKIESQTT